MKEEEWGESGKGRQQGNFISVLTPNPPVPLQGTVQLLPNALGPKAAYIIRRTRLTRRPSAPDSGATTTPASIPVLGALSTPSQCNRNYIGGYQTVEVTEKRWAKGVSTTTSKTPSLPRSSHLRSVLQRRHQQWSRWKTVASYLLWTRTAKASSITSGSQFCISARSGQPLAKCYFRGFIVKFFPDVPLSMLG